MTRQEANRNIDSRSEGAAPQIDNMSTSAESNANQKQKEADDANF